MEATTLPAGARHTYFKYKVLDDPALQQRLTGKGWWEKQQASCGGCSERVSRLLRLVGFLLTFCVSLFRAMAPWCLAVIETGSMLLIWFLMTPHSLKHFHYTSSLEDLILLSVAQCPAVLLAYALGLGHRQQRPYWFTALSCACIGYIYVAVKLCFFHGALRPGPLTIILGFLGFCTAHVLIARDVSLWAQKRYEMGLLGFGYPWEEGEAAFVHRHKHVGYELQKDVPGRTLADADSRFIKCNGLEVHYKEAFPEAASAHPDACILLIHGFGGGVFAWRHVMQRLADSSGCRVLAFDRAGFGLTSRPLWSKHSTEPNPYSNAAQAQLIQKLCRELGLQRIIVAGHSDGALIALLAAADAVREHESAVMSCNSDSAAEASSSNPRNDSLGSHAAAQAASRGSTADGTDAPLGVTSRLGHSRRGSMHDVEGLGHVPQVMGLALMHPCLAGEARPQLSRLLGNSRIGWRLLRSLLKSEVGIVAHRKAWFDSRKLTPDIIAQYKAPLQVEGWDHALMQVGKSSKALSPSATAAACRSVSAVPTLVIVGEADRVAASAASCSRMLAHSRLSILPRCGHLSHEEVPESLAGSLASFVQESLQEILV